MYLFKNLTTLIFSVFLCFFTACRARTYSDQQSLSVVQSIKDKQGYFLSLEPVENRKDGAHYFKHCRVEGGEIKGCKNAFSAAESWRNGKDESSYIYLLNMDHPATQKMLEKQGTGKAIASFVGLGAMAVGGVYLLASGLTLAEVMPAPFLLRILGFYPGAAFGVFTVSAVLTGITFMVFEGNGLMSWGREERTMAKYYPAIFNTKDSDKPQVLEDDISVLDILKPLSKILQLDINPEIARI